MKPGILARPITRQYGRRTGLGCPRDRQRWRSTPLEQSASLYAAAPPTACYVCLSASIGNNVRRAGSSSLPRPYCHFELQRGPAPNIAHSFFASPEKPFGSGRDVGDIQRLGRAANGRAVAAEFLLFRISHSLIGRVQRFLQLYKLGCRSALTNKRGLAAMHQCESNQRSTGRLLAFASEVNAGGQKRTCER
jgi:hypothetical protein